MSAGWPGPLGLCTLDRSPLVGGDGDLVALVDAAADAGFGAVSIDVFTLTALGPGAWRGVRARCEARGVRIVELAAHNITPDPVATDADLAATVAMVDALSPDSVMVRVGAGLDLADAGVGAAVRRAVDAFAARGARSTLEPSPFGPVSSLAAVGAVAAAAGRPLGLVLDVWHVAHGVAGLDEVRAVDPAGVAAVQLSDVREAPPGDLAALQQATMHGRTVPGAGSAPVAAFVAALRDAGVRAPLLLEVLDDEHRRDPVDVYVARLRAALDVTLAASLTH